MQRSDPHGLAESATDLVPHLFAEGFPARGPLRLGDIVPVEDVEIVEDRIPIARHRQQPELFGNRFAGTCNLPFSYHVGTGVRRETAQLRHVGDRQRPADGVTEFLAKTFQLMAGHGGINRPVLPR